jgi:hypothetical protein
MMREQALAMGDKNKTAAEKELAKKNVRLAIILGLVAVGFYVWLLMLYM